MLAPEARVQAERLRLAFGQTWTAATSIPVVAAIYAWTFWSAVDPRGLLVWYSACLALVAVRVLVYLAYQRVRHPVAESLSRWSRVLVVSAGLQGALFGFGFTYFPAQAESPYGILGVAWTIGVSAVSITAYSVDVRVVLAYFLPIVVPSVVHVFSLGSTLGVAMGLGLVAYSVVVLRSMLPLSRTAVEAIRLNFRLADEIDARKHVEAQLRQLSQKDGLTGLSNRRHFEETLEAEFRRARRSRLPLSLILIDLDAFKAFNDTYGHPAGDDCLLRVSHVVRTALRRPGDLAARYGGEELACILPSTPEADAYVVAECIRRNVLELEIPHSGTLVEGQAHVTVSAGVACLRPDQDAEPADLVRHADESLYESKAGGRNRVTCRGLPAMPSGEGAPESSPADRS